VFSMRALEEAHQEAVKPQEREHVTPFINQQPHRYRLANVAYASDQSRYRWTVDTPDDFQLISRMLENLIPRKPQFSLEDALDLMKQFPEWAQLNAHVEQKKLTVTQTKE